MLMAPRTARLLHAGCCHKWRQTEGVGPAAKSQVCDLHIIRSQLMIYDSVTLRLSPWQHRCSTLGNDFQHVGGFLSRGTDTYYYYAL